jgi:hypothetical protein
MFDPSSSVDLEKARLRRGADPVRQLTKRPRAATNKSPTIPRGINAKIALVLRLGLAGTPQVVPATLSVGCAGQSVLPRFSNFAPLNDEFLPCLRPVTNCYHADGTKEAPCNQYSYPG